MSLCYETAYLASRRPAPGAAALVRALKRTVQVGIITNGDLGDADVKLRFCDLRHFVDSIVASAQAGYQEPNPRVFRMALEGLGGEDPRRAVMIGDTWRTDVLGARAADMDAMAESHGS